mgnify:CR=1 FL=1
MLYEDITKQIISAFYNVNNTLGFGFLKKVYENAMKLELNKMGLKVEQQKNILDQFVYNKLRVLIMNIIIARSMNNQKISF